MALLLSHRLAIGVSDYGGDSDPGDTLSFGHGGVVVRYHFPLQSSPFYFSLGALTAAGAVSDSSEDREGGDDDDAVFVFEPQVSGHPNLTRWLRAGVDMGYRLVSGSGAIPARNAARSRACTPSSAGSEAEPVPSAPKSSVGLRVPRPVSRADPARGRGKAGCASAGR
jgi:hypothetical protein